MTRTRIAFGPSAVSALVVVPNRERGLLPERGNCAVYEEGEITETYG